MAKGIYRAYQYFGRGCEISGIFCMEKELVQQAKAECDEHSRVVYYSEFAGKHSEAPFELNDDTIKLVTEDPNAVAVFCSFKLEHGENPVARYFEYKGEGDWDE